MRDDVLVFTGIIHHCGEIERIEKKPSHIELVIYSDFTDLELGESIAVDGVCLTVADFDKGNFKCELSPETVALSIARSYEKGKKVNLERSLRLMDRLGGHFVMGHVDCQYQIEKKIPRAEFQEITFKKEENSTHEYLVKKGSVAVNGVSLTLNEVTERGFSVMLIPHTLKTTNLSELIVDSYVNVEYDYLAKLVINYVSEQNGFSKY